MIFVLNNTIYLNSYAAIQGFPLDVHTIKILHNEIVLRAGDPQSHTPQGKTVFSISVPHTVNFTNCPQKLVFSFNNKMGTPATIKILIYYSFSAMIISNLVMASNLRTWSGKAENVNMKVNINIPLIEPVFAPGHV